jgi:GntR family transcriptional regulator
VNFRRSYPIYRQVADVICEKVLTAAWRDGERLPAIKDLAVLTSVNPNTVVKALTWLQENAVLTTQRGVGYFLTDGAARKTLELKRREFIEDDLPGVFNSMRLLDLSLDEFAALYHKHRTPTTGSKPAAITDREVQGGKK